MLEQLPTLLGFALSLCVGKIVEPVEPGRDNDDATGILVDFTRLEVNTNLLGGHDNKIQLADFCSLKSRDISLVEAVLLLSAVVNAGGGSAGKANGYLVPGRRTAFVFSLILSSGPPVFFFHLRVLSFHHSN